MKKILLTSALVIGSAVASQAALVQYYAFDGDATATVGTDGT
jgi:hypothetical protein